MKGILCRYQLDSVTGKRTELVWFYCSKTCRDGMGRQGEDGKSHRDAKPGSCCDNCGVEVA